MKNKVTAVQMILTQTGINAYLYKAGGGYRKYENISLSSLDRLNAAIYGVAVKQQGRKGKRGKVKQ